MWTIMLAASIMIVVYLLFIVGSANEISQYHPVAQFLIILTISVIYVFAAFLYFILKYPTLF